MASATASALSSAFSTRPCRRGGPCGSGRPDHLPLTGCVGHGQIAAIQGRRVARCWQLRLFAIAPCRFERWEPLGGTMRSIMRGLRLWAQWATGRRAPTGSVFELAFSLWHGPATPAGRQRRSQPQPGLRPGVQALQGAGRELRCLTLEPLRRSWWMDRLEQLLRAVPLRVEDLQMPGAGGRASRGASAWSAGAIGLIHTDGCQFRFACQSTGRLPAWYLVHGLWGTRHACSTAA